MKGSAVDHGTSPLSPEEMIQAAAKQRDQNAYVVAVLRNNKRTGAPTNASPPDLVRAQLHTSRPGAYRIHRSSGVADEEMQQQQQHDESGDERTPSNQSTENSSYDDDEENHTTTQHKQVMLEAELVPHHLDDGVVVKAEPIRACKNRLLLLLLLFILISMILLAAIVLPKILSQQSQTMTFVRRDTFPYYTHHSVLFGAHDASLQDVRVKLSCGNGAIATKDVNGPCDDRPDGTIDCSLGNVVGDYNRHIFFSCGSDFIDSPVASVSVDSKSGDGLRYLSLHQLCQDETTLPRNSICSGSMHSFEDGMSVCFAMHELKVETTGVSCPSAEPFVPSPAQAEFADLRDDIIIAWLERGEGVGR